MGSTTDFKNGLILRIKDNLWKIVEFQHVKPGKGAAFVRSKLKNIKTGQVVENTFRAGEKVETVRVESHSYNFSYSDGDDYYFMDNETYEQISLSKSSLYTFEPAAGEGSPPPQYPKLFPTIVFLVPLTSSLLETVVE